MSLLHSDPKFSQSIHLSPKIIAELAHEHPEIPQPNRMPVNKTASFNSLKTLTNPVPKTTLNSPKKLSTSALFLLIKFSQNSYYNLSRNLTKSVPISPRFFSQSTPFLHFLSQYPLPKLSLSISPFNQSKTAHKFTKKLSYIHDHTKEDRRN